MFILKLLFVIILLAAIYLLARTVISKFKNPDKSLKQCIPYLEDFSLVNVDLEKQDESDQSVTVKKIIPPHDSIEVSSTEKPKPAKKPSVKKSPTKKSVAKKLSKAKKRPKKKTDNIKKINGIGPVFEKKLHAAGINSFAHIAKWSDEDAERFDRELELGGRPQREEWVANAIILAAAQAE